MSFLFVLPSACVLATTKATGAELAASVGAVGVETGQPTSSFWAASLAGLLNSVGLVAVNACGISSTFGLWFARGNSQC